MLINSHPRNCDKENDMDFLLPIINNPIVQILGFIFLLLEIANRIEKSRKWLESYALTKWATKIPWIWFFMGVGVITGTNIAINSNDIYRGLSATLISISLGLGIQWLVAFRKVVHLDAALQETSSNHKRLAKGLKRIAHILPAEFKINDWKMTHTIDEDGSDVLYEELTLTPTSKPVYFYSKRYSLPHEPNNSALRVTVENLLDNTPLAFFETDRSDNSIRYIILLDPPSTVTSPKRIAIKCIRKELWTGLIYESEEEGAIQTTYKADSLQIELVAPRSKTWKGFRLAPSFGDVKIESSSSMSRVIWIMKNVKPKKYFYHAFWKDKEQ